MPKLIPTAALVLTLGLVLAACNPNNNQQASTTPSTTTPSAPQQQEGTAPAEGADRTPAETVNVSLGYVGASAWLVTEVSGAQNLAELDTQNATLALEVGQRYTFNNPQAQVHPFALRDADGNYLLAQGSTQGALEQATDINFIDDGTTVAFTLTQELADRVASYICVVHPPMVGEVTVASGA